MLQLIVMCTVLILLLLFFNALVDRAAGVDAENLTSLVEGSITIFSLYAIIVYFCGAGMANYNGIPFLDKIEAYDSISNMFHNGFSDFLLECTELISLTFLISLITRIFPDRFGGTGLTGTIIRNIVIVSLCMVINNVLLTYIAENEIFKWAVTALRVFLTGTALVVTPAMIIGNLLRINNDSPIVDFIVCQLPQTTVGKAMSTAITNSLLLIFVIMAFESQVGSLTSMIASAGNLVGFVGVFALLMIGIKMLIYTILK